MSSLEYLGPLLDQLREPLTSLSLVASIMGVILSLLSTWRRGSRALLKKAEDSVDQLTIQISHIKGYLEKQLFQERINKFSSYALNTSQYVVGGALVTSFISDTLPKDVLGMLGAVTLLSSFAHQQLRPDIKRVAAARRVVELTELLRAAEITAAGISEKADPQLTLSAAREYMVVLHRIQRDELTSPLPG